MKYREVACFIQYVGYHFFINGKQNDVNLEKFGYANPFNEFVGSEINGSFFSPTYRYGEHLGIDFMVKEDVEIKSI